jgi:hypothetical protein
LIDIPFHAKYFSKFGWSFFMSEKEKNEKPRLKYKKPEAQRLTDTKAHGGGEECTVPRSGNSLWCMTGNTAGFGCDEGNDGAV